MAVPLDNESVRLFPLRIPELKGNKFIVLDIRFPAVVEKFGRPRTPQAGGHGTGSSLGIAYRLDDVLDDQFEVIQVHAALKQGGTPQAERVGAFVVMRATYEHIGEAGKLPADLEHLRMEETNDIDRDESHLGLTVLEDDGPGLEGIKKPGRLAVVAKAGEVHRPGAELRGNVRFAEA